MTTTSLSENQAAFRLPAPSKTHATCAWCRVDFHTVVELIDHVDRGHLPARGLAA